MQVTTETELLERSEKLEQALQENTLLQFCSDKADATDDTDDKQIWSFLKVTILSSIFGFVITILFCTSVSLLLYLAFLTLIVKYEVILPSQNSLIRRSTLVLISVVHAVFQNPP